MTVNLYPPEFEDVAQEASVYGNLLVVGCKSSIAENMPAGTEVLKVSAVDPENKDGKVVYSIVGGDGIGFFSIDASGELSLLTARIFSAVEE